MFELSADEVQILKCQIGISSSGYGGRWRFLPCAFTEQGVAMLSSVLRSERAVQATVEKPFHPVGADVRRLKVKGLKAEGK